ncbi:MAG TPA: PhzF family phenazine biosynthesis protein [Verrucomicrobiae bacterium]|nr:PhzF family phenazine biosynthesis protein [Verrucomicrobiae bacterium]
MKRRIYQLDVFTTKAYAGNPLAVVTDGDDLSTRQMQAVAREMNLAETVFVQRPTNNRALARLRIFTTTRELPLAGHPVIGTWFLLAELGVVPASEGPVQIQQQTGAGILPVEIVFHEGRPARVTMTQKDAKFKPVKISRQKIAAALGLKSSDIDSNLPLESVSTGIFNLMVPLRGRATLGKIHSNLRELFHLLNGNSTMAYCFALGSRGKAFARGMLPWEIFEDPATGSAGGSLGAYLVKHGKLKPREELSITQGVEMGRPSDIHVQIANSKGRLVPRVSGSAVRVLEGQIEI